MHIDYNGGFEYVGIEPTAADPMGRFRLLDRAHPEMSVEDGPKYWFGGIGKWRRQTNGALRAAMLREYPYQPILFLERAHPDGPPRVVDASGAEVDAKAYGSFPYDGVRHGKEMEDAVRTIEDEQQPYDIHDEHGRKLCSITYDPLTGDIFRIQAEPYENIEQEAEHKTELICVTEEGGTLTGERITRQEARENKKRYLVVSLLLQHENSVGVARRSGGKTIDAGKEGVSAHGVAKLLFRPDGSPITDIRYAALVNTALELSEELRYGKETKPFTVIVWPGSERELFIYMHEHPIDDPNTVYLAGGMLFADHGYPLGEWQNARTRFVINGYVFAKSKPEINVDPSEVDGFRWLSLKEFAAQENVADDALRCAETSYRTFLSARTQWGFHHSHDWINNNVNCVFHPDVPMEWNKP